MNKSIFIGAVILSGVISSFAYAESGIFHAIEPGALYGYPDLIVTINNGSGSLQRTRIGRYASNDCSGGVSYQGLSGTQFSYVSGDAYRANLAFFFPVLFTQSSQSAQLQLRDSTFSQVSGECLTVTCSSSTECTFSPPTTSITFP